MKTIVTFIGISIFLAAISALFYGAYLAVGHIWQLYAGLDAIMRLILLSSFSVFLVGCFVVAGAMKTAAQTRLKGQLVEAKITLYKSIVDLYEQYFSGTQTDNARSQQNALNRLAALYAELNVIAGSSVIESHRKLEGALERHEEDDKLQALYQQLIRKMRQDLGHGTLIEETRLKFLLNKGHVYVSDSTGYEVSA